MINLTGCFGNKREFIVTRLDEETTETKNTLRPASVQKIDGIKNDAGVKKITEEKNINVFIDPGISGKEVTPGKLTISPGDVFLAEGDFKKLIKMAKDYNVLVKNLKDLTKEGKISLELHNKLLGQ